MKTLLHSLDSLLCVNRYSTRNDNSLKRRLSAEHLIVGEIGPHLGDQSLGSIELSLDGRTNSDEIRVGDQPMKVLCMALSLMLVVRGCRRVLCTLWRNLPMRPTPAMATWRFAGVDILPTGTRSLILFVSQRNFVFEVFDSWFLRREASSLYTSIKAQHDQNFPLRIRASLRTHASLSSFPEALPPSAIHEA